MNNISGHIDPYHVLQVQRHAAPEVIRAAYRALAWRYHPDHGASPEGMVLLNHAWSILGDPKRRAAYDAGTLASRPSPTPATTPRATDIDAAPREPGLAARRQAAENTGTGTVIDFGRYEGWTIRQLVDQDPDYLRWLVRTPVGRRLAPEIDAALSGHERVAARA
jgi:curved DNA-binding protein CbpA